MSAVCVALVCLTVLVLAYRGESYVQRLVTLAEQRQQRPAPRVIPPMPVDLQLHVRAESEGWAQEQAMQRMMEQYDTLGSWDAVRQAHGRG